MAVFFGFFGHSQKHKPSWAREKWRVRAMVVFRPSSGRRSLSHAKNLTRKTGGCSREEIFLQRTVRHAKLGRRTALVLCWGGFRDWRRLDRQLMTNSRTPNYSQFFLLVLSLDRALRAGEGGREGRGTAETRDAGFFQWSWCRLNARSGPYSFFWYIALKSSAPNFPSLSTSPYSTTSFDSVGCRANPR